MVRQGRQGGWQKEKCGESQVKEGSIGMNLEDRVHIGNM